MKHVRVNLFFPSHTEKQKIIEIVVVRRQDSENGRKLAVLANRISIRRWGKR